MSDIRVKGFDEVSFWREEEIGLIVIRSTSSGQIHKKTLDELIMALSTASIDPSVKSIAITGQNEVFAREISDWNDSVELLNSARALASIVYSLEKPIFAIVNGDATDAGFELALLCDVIISSPEAQLGFSKEHNFILGGSLSSLRVSAFEISKAERNVNCDYVFQASDLLGSAKEKIDEIGTTRLVQRRKNRLRFIREAVGEEHMAFLTSLMNEGKENTTSTK